MQGNNSKMRLKILENTVNHETLKELRSSRAKRLYPVIF